MTGPTYVELVNGDIVASDAEEWRHECLARHVLNLPSLQERREWLADFGKRHGEAELTRLQDTMTALWAKERSAA